ncbi:MAG: RibD family protein [Planctomycetota bacterium]
MPSELLDDAWSAMLEARHQAMAGAGDLVFLRHGDRWSCAAADDSAIDTATEILQVGSVQRPAPRHARVSRYAPQQSGVPTFTHPDDRPVATGLLTFARLYLPTVLGAAAARRAGRSFVVAHVTQSLDGRIACANGQSQWIGNDEDMRHAHRMRALCDGVLVGAGTAMQDDPRLTVRHVDGPDPRRIVLSGRGRVLATLGGRNLANGPGCIVVLGDDVEAEPPTAHVELLPVTATDDGRLDPIAITTALRGQGVHSLYLEGGAATASSFLQAKAIDLLQVHVAAIVLGSGIASFDLHPIEHVRDALPVTMDHVALNGHLLLNCWPRR